MNLRVLTLNIWLDPRDREKRDSPREAARAEQALFITELEEKRRQTAPTILAGDFDAAPDQDCIRFYTGKSAINGRSAAFRDSWAIAGDGTPGYTWTTDSPWVARSVVDAQGIVRTTGCRSRTIAASTTCSPARRRTTSRWRA